LKPLIEKFNFGCVGLTPLTLPPTTWEPWQSPQLSHPKFPPLPTVTSPKLLLPQLFPTVIPPVIPPLSLSPVTPCYGYCE
jgi:hypothetical protein